MIEKLLVKSVITYGVLLSVLSCRSSGDAINIGETSVRINLFRQWLYSGRNFRPTSHNKQSENK